MIELLRRRRPIWCRALILAALLGLAAGAAAAAADPFYQRLFQDGSLALSRGDHAGAARQLRLACFGMLDTPEPLAVCLARLAAAQSHLEEPDALLDTLGRILELERRFQVYAAVELSPEVRRALETTVQTWAPPEALAELPAFRHIAVLQRRDAEAATADGDEPLSAEDSDEPEPSLVTRDDPDEPGPGEPTEVEEGVLAQNRQILVAGARDRFGDAFDSVRVLAERHGGWMDAQLVAAELAYRLSRWDDAVFYFQRADDRLDERPELQFYLAVALYKSGDLDAARAMLDRCLPRIAVSEYVDYWVERIRGSG